MWAEASSALHEATWRGEADPVEAADALSELERLPIASRSPRQLGRVTWRLAEELGCRVVTVDNRLRRGADRLGLVVLPTEL
jgi:hypothetical protein